MSFTCFGVSAQHGGSEVKTHHLEYSEGGILDMDDLVSELVEDRDKVRMSHSLQYLVYLFRSNLQHQDISTCALTHVWKDLHHKNEQWC